MVKFLIEFSFDKLVFFLLKPQEEDNDNGYINIWMFVTT